MSKLKSGIILLTLVCLIATGWAISLLGGVNATQLNQWVDQAGFWAPLVYVAIYVVATILILPSTALNLIGGGIFGPWLGLLWTSLAAILAAIAAFAFSRSLGRRTTARWLAGRWQAMDIEIQRGGVFYMFAIRLVPIMPYGLVNFAAGLTSIRFQDFLIGTTLGTVPSILPFVWLGSSSVKAFSTGDILPVVGALALTGILVAGSTWIKQRRLTQAKPDSTAQRSR